MTRRPASRARQRGAALLVIAALLILGVAWGAFAAIKRGTVSPQEREVLTGQALLAAKQALLAYAAQYAARTDHDKPGRMPCPEALSSIGTAAEGDEAAGCNNAAANLGRLPWRTLGIDRLDDGSGEPLWYALSPGFRGVTPTTVINFDTPGQLMYDGTANAAVAVIIAPGRPLNTLADAATLPGWCPAKVNQYAADRKTAPLVPANFLECGNATGSYRNPGSLAMEQRPRDHHHRRGMGNRHRRRGQRPHPAPGGAGTGGVAGDAIEHQLERELSARRLAVSAILRPMGFAAPMAYARV